jgi:hypothetical protein
MTIETILNSDMSVAYITDCATSPVILIKNCNLLNPRPPKRTSNLQENPSALKRERPNMKFLNFFLFLWVILALLDPDPDPDSESYTS